MIKKWTVKKTIGLVSILLILALIGLAIYQSKISENTTESQFVTEELTRHSIVSSVSGTGTVMASSSEDVMTELLGYKVMEVLVQEGDMVSAGDVICKLDMSDVQARKNEVVKAKKEVVDNKNATDANYDAQIANNQASRGDRLAQAVANRDAKKAAYEKATQEYNSYYEGDYKPKLLSGKTEAQLALSGEYTVLQQKRMAMDSAEANYNTAEAQVTSIQQENDQTLVDAKTNYDTNQDEMIRNYDETIRDLNTTIEKGTVRSTISGAVTSVNVKPGRTFNGGTIATVEGLNEFYVEGSIDEYDVADVAAGMKAVMKTDATRDEELNGYVTYVALKATGGNSSSGSMQDYTALLNGDMSSLAGGMSSSGNDANYKVKISLNDQNSRLRLGMNVKISIVTQSAEDVLAVPYGAIQTREDGSTYIEVIDEEASVPDEKGRVTQVTKELDVTVGLQGSYYYEIKGPDIKEGLQVVVPDDDSSQSMDELLNMVGNAGGV